MKTLSVYGECDEADDPTVYEQAAKDAFQWLADHGYKSNAIALVEEIGLSLHIVPISRKSSSGAKKDGDWKFLTEGIKATTTEIELRQWEIDTRSLRSVMPLVWHELLKDEIERHSEKLKGSENA